MHAARANAAVAGQRRRRHLKHKHHTSLAGIEVESSSGSSSSESSDEEAEDEDVRCRVIHDITKSDRFSCVVAGMIVLNIVVMGLQTNYQDFYLPLSCSGETQARRAEVIDYVLAVRRKQEQDSASTGRRLGRPGSPRVLNRSAWSPTAGDGAVQVDARKSKSRSLLAAAEGAPASPPDLGLNETEVMLKTFSVTMAVDEFAKERGCTDLWFFVNMVILLFFIGELVLRLITYGWSFFTSEDQFWNFFDLLVVCMGSVGVVMRLMFTTVHTSKLVLMVRVVRVLRILRVLRLFKQFKKLSLLIRGLVESFAIVVWICLLMLMFMVVYAIFTTTLIGHSADRYANPDDVKMYFGCVYNSTVTLFQFVTLDSWSDITRMVWHEQPVMVPAFLVYVVVVSLVVMSLFTGVLAEHMNVVRESEEALEEQERQTSLIQATRILYEAFRRVDVDNNKSINFEEFKVLVNDGELTETLASIDLKLTDFDPEELFLCFDQACDGKLTWMDFKEGLEELRRSVGPPQIFQLNAAMHRIVEAQLQAKTPATPMKVPALESMPPDMVRTFGEVNEAMSGIEETLGGFRDELRDFVAELRKKKQRSTS